MVVQQAQLPYAMDALAPVMSLETLDFHYGKHHSAYVTNVNKLIEGTELAYKSLEEIIVATYGNSQKKEIFNNAAQVWNHNFFWQSMTPETCSISGKLAKKLIEDFGSIEDFKALFINAALKQFGSGWVWLVCDNEKLEIVTTSNAHTLLVSSKTALLVCDIWEHSYYIDYRNRRADYVKEWLEKLANWEFAALSL